MLVLEYADEVVLDDYVVLDVMQQHIEADEVVVAVELHRVLNEVTDVNEYSS